MVTHHHIQGYENFFEYMKNFKPNEPVYVLYTGTKLPNGKSWCPDCVEAEPFIEEGFKAAPEGTHFVEVQVGDRPFWKDPNCPFRTNSITKLKVLPTLAKWGTQKRLEGNQLSQLDLINMLLTDED
ncbi:Thioredoxin domain-containing protein 17 [Habropoda laboriosa]|uniref:Thioredoxin domain-containing protein 17 n=1 Tax=Habropoda laboriosa TaxID=597456 RepID=A0A0L7R8T5_9HYME|nr:PREDICTED: thioredoxin domain-containing protein 17-like [Habropoda laboriosa]KOC67181.1 Thioredoxin domain-containing protein 17 [Habropoda laboriosa]